MRHVLAALVATAAVSVYGTTILDGTGGLSTTVTASRWVGNASAASASGLWSGTKYGVSLTTTSSFTLLRLDVALNAASGSAVAVDFLVEVWAVTGALPVGPAPLFSAHALGTVSASGGKGYASLVLPAYFVLSAGGAFAVTLSPQTPSTAPLNMWGFGAPNATAGVTVLGDALSTSGGASWTSPGSGTTFGGLRLVDVAGASFTGTQVWTDQQTGNTANFALVGTPLGTRVAAVGFTVPNSGAGDSFGLATFGVGLCGSFTTGTVFVSLALYAGVVSAAGLVSPTTPSLATAGPFTATGTTTGAFFNANLSSAAWVLSYAAAAPYYFVTVSLSGSSSAGIKLCTAQKTVSVQSDTWAITGVGGEWGAQCNLNSPCRHTHPPPFPPQRTARARAFPV